MGLVLALAGFLFYAIYDSTPIAKWRFAKKNPDIIAQRRWLADESRKANEEYMRKHNTKEPPIKYIE